MHCTDVSWAMCTGGAEALAASAAGPAAGGSALSNLAAGVGGGSHLLSWADKTFGQGLGALTKGVRLRLQCLTSAAGQQGSFEHCGWQLTNYILVISALTRWSISVPDRTGP